MSNMLTYYFKYNITGKNCESIANNKYKAKKPTG